MMYRQGSPPPPPVAEKRCLYCGVAADPSAMICVCGAALPPANREEPEWPLACPRCSGAELSFTATDPKHYGRHCASCGGLFVPAQAWTELLGTASTVEAALVDASDAAPLPVLQLFPLAACPACHTTMERATFAARSGISVDVCIVHGIWFDAGELFQTMRWLADGRPLALPTNQVVELRVTARTPEPTNNRLENGNDVYMRLAAAGSLLALRRLFPWR